jgi:hypothetical protein
MRITPPVSRRFINTHVSILVIDFAFDLHHHVGHLNKITAFSKRQM